MIGEYTLKMLCEKYQLDSEKLITRNNNILEFGEYQDIDKTLDYLINELSIAPSNIEKCPSILYRNVDSIKQNVTFLKRQKISFDKIESCLHVLSSDPIELEETYNYVKDNYGEGTINKITSVLSVPKAIIIDVEKLNIPFVNKIGNLSVAIGINMGSTNLEEVQKIIQSPEFRDHLELFTSTTLVFAKFEEIKKMIQSDEFRDFPELFTSQTLAYAKLEEIQKIIRSKEFKDHSELFTSETLAHAKLDEIQNIIRSPEFRDHPELFTSTTLAYAKFEEIQKIIQSPEYKEHPELFTSETLAHAKLDEIQKMIQSEEFRDYPELFTSETLAHAKLEEIQKMIRSQEFRDHPELFTSTTIAHAKLEDIQQLLKMECWKDERFKNLLTSSVVAKSKSIISKIPILIQIAEEYKIDRYLNTTFLICSPSQNYALIQYLNEKHIPLIMDEKLNSIFGKQPGVLKKKYGVDIKELIAKYPLEIAEVKDMGGGKKI